MSSVGEEILVELERNRELLRSYRDIGPAGSFGHAMISQDIVDAEEALEGEDVIAVLRCYDKLRGNE